MDRTRYPGQKRQKKKRKGLMFFRLFLCFLIIIGSVVVKHLNEPVVEKLSQALNEEFKVSEAVEAVSGIAKKGNDILEVFKNKEEDESVSQEVFESDYYLTEDLKELEREIEESRKESELRQKELSVETLSFQMSEEELSDDTKPEIFRIPPPANSTYVKENIGFKYTSPLYGVITSRFGYRDHPIVEDASFHTGLDIAAKKGTAIVAFADGRVVSSGKNSTYGNYLLIEHSSGIKSFYGHNSKLCVREGQKIKLGQKIAEVGSTGMSTGPHLHFEIRKNNIRLDPGLYISPESV
ncbi:MAG: M23 family metallopeptidase [Oscillospiraceae bacterium]|nr:M23 family metallopeptidase [Oscillospiraceae bacterium]